MITVYDAINTKAGNIPRNAPGIAYYVNGLYKWSQSQIDYFPTIFKIGISITHLEDGEVLDIENMDATPAEVPGWMDTFNRTGLYCNVSTLPDVLTAIGSRPKRLWIASPGPPILQSGWLARQYAYPGLYDISVFDEAWWPHPFNEEFKDMDVLMNDGTDWYTVGNNSKHRISSPTEGSALAATLPAVKTPVPNYLASLPTV